MKIDDIEAFVAVVRCQSISVAAQELGLTQPAITRRIQNFEEALGITLLDRQTKPPRPTELGLRVREQCVTILREIEVLHDLTASDLQPMGRVRLGLTQGLGELLALSLLQQSRQRWPDLSPVIATGTGGQTLLERLERQEFDAIVVFLPQGAVLPKTLQGEKLASTQLAVIGRRDEWPKARYRLADCQGRGWILNPDGCGFRNSLRRALAAQHLPLVVNLDTYGHELQLRSASQSLGLALMPLSLFERSQPPAELAPLPITDFRPKLDLWLLHGPLPARLQQPMAHVASQVAAGFAPVSSPSPG